MAVIVGTDFNDLLLGLPTDDTYLGNPGDDLIYGGAGNDSLNGGDGSDALYGNEGSDALTGGLGIDTFHFDAAPTAQGDVDQITDFQLGESVRVSNVTLLPNVLSGELSAVLDAGQVLVGTASGGLTRIYIGTDTLPGADISMDLVGSFLSTDLWVNPATGQITYDPLYYVPLNLVGTELSEALAGNGGQGGTLR